MSLIATHTILEAFANEWVKLFRRNPFVTIAATITAIAILVVVGLKIESSQEEKRQSTRLENSNYKEQVGKIDEMEKSVTQLLTFLEDQKKSLDETQDTIVALESERDKLKPLVETDQKVVDAIFRVQEERANSGVWRERLIGFGLGIVASLFASFLWLVITKLARGRKTNGERQPATAVDSKSEGNDKAKLESEGRPQ